MLFLVSLCLGSLLAARPVPPVAPVPRVPVKIETIARDLVTNFNARRFAAATREFNESLAQVVTPAVLAEQKTIIDSQVGAFLSITSAREYRHDDFPVVELTCRHERASIAFRVVFDHYNRIGAIFTDPVVAPKVDAELEAAAREFLKNFAAGEFEKATKGFNPSMRTQLTPAKLAELGQSIASRFGKFRSVDEVSQASDEKLRAVTISASFDKSPVEVRLVFSVDGAIAGLRIGPLTTVR